MEQISPARLYRVIIPETVSKAAAKKLSLIIFFMIEGLGLSDQFDNLKIYHAYTADKCTLYEMTG